MIPADAVEITARYLYKSASAGVPYASPWDNLSEDALKAWKREAAWLLKSVAPSIAARAWDEGAKEQARCYGMDKDTGPNPYR